MDPLLPETPPRVLFAYREDVDLRGGAAAVMHHTADALRAVGAQCEITIEAEPNPDGFDVVHPVNIWAPSSALDQLRHLHGTGAPIAWQPFYLHWCEFAWAAMCVQALTGRSADERARIIAGMADGSAVINGLSRWTPNEVHPGLHAQIAEMASLVDHICACSAREMQMLFQTCGLRATPFTVTPHGIDAARYAGADPEPFRRLVGEEPFVLCVGAIDLRKNQALLAHALSGSEHRLVLVGPCFEPATLEIVKELGGPRLRHIDRVAPELVASALAGASAHVMPSYAEGSSLASMEAAAAGCPVVVSNRSSEFEYYGDGAVYCNPADPESIRLAVDEAVRRGHQERERVEELRRRISGLTWEATACATLGAYRRAIAAGKRRARAQTGLDDARRTLVLAFATELIAEPDLLAAYGRRVRGGDDVTLVIATAEDAQGALMRAVTAAGLDGDDSPDLLAVPDAIAVARAVDGTLTRRELSGPLAHLRTVALEPLAAAA